MSDVPCRTARTNRLADATSPYLLQHAHDPVDWYPWGPEAFAKAAAEDKPIFLSIGYSACHWCHVMAHECFRDDEIAAILNGHFVSIKVDREERPDVDEIYMSATLLCTQGHGGWPMSVFLLPDARPFFAGTYFPARSRHGRLGFQDILLEIARRWRDDRTDFEEGAAALTQAVRRLSTPTPASDTPGPDLIDRAIRQYQRAFDRRHGGILSGGTNKFPPAMCLQLMLRRCRNRPGPGLPATASDLRPEDDILHLVELTLERMARGGIYDQLGGGICRYSTDPQWLVPHFEKMLYDQALVSDAFLDAFQLTHRPLYRRIAGEILDFVLREMVAPEGAFYTAFDADSEGAEGKYYLWTLDEIRQILSERDAACFAAAYGVKPGGNWHDPRGHGPPGPTNILHMPHSLASVARTLGMTEEELEASVERSRRRLLKARARRTPPGLDDKILTAWNGLMITSLARGSRILDEPRYLRAAARAADFLLTRLVRNGRLLRTCRGDRAHMPGFLDDYAFLIEGLIHMYEASFEPRWLEHAVCLLRDTIKHFLDPQGGFFFTADDCRTALFRPRESADGALPSGNSVMAMNLLRLAALLDRPEWRDCAESVFRALGGRLSESPLGFDRLLAALDFFYTEPTQVVIVGPTESPETQALVRTLWQVYLPAKVVAGLDPTDGPAKALAGNVPLLRGRAMVGGRPTAYVCRRFTCGPPATDEDSLRRQLASP